MAALSADTVRWALLFSANQQRRKRAHAEYVAARDELDALFRQAREEGLSVRRMARLAGVQRERAYDSLRGRQLQRPRWALGEEAADAST